MIGMDNSMLVWLLALLAVPLAVVTIILRIRQADKIKAEKKERESLIQLPTPDEVKEYNIKVPEIDKIDFAGGMVTSVSSRSSLDK